MLYMLFMEQHALKLCPRKATPPARTVGLVGHVTQHLDGRTTQDLFIARGFHLRQM